MKDAKLALTEKSRSALYTGFSELIDNEEAKQEMLSYFPARDVEEPVTKEFLQTALAETELRITTTLRSEINGQISGLRTEMNGQISGLRTEMQRMIWINVATLTAFAGVIFAAVRL